MEAARSVLSVVLREYKAAGKSRHELIHIMEEEVDGIVNSAGLTDLQRDLLTQELDLYRYAPTGHAKPVQTQPDSTAGNNVPTKAYRTALGRNIDRLRKECGWSFDLLAESTKLDKKLILGHVNEGKGAHLNTLKTYADVFTRRLNRNVTVAELAV